MSKGVKKILALNEPIKDDFIKETDHTPTVIVPVVVPVCTFDPPSYNWHGSAPHDA
jgi:hypothetical protein